MIPLLLAAAAFAEDCPSRPDAAALSARLLDAESAYAALDIARFGTAMDGAAFLVPCLGDVLSPAAASRYHRLQGLRQFVARNDERATLSFAAARAADPNAGFSEALVPPGHALRTLYDAYPLENRTDEPVPEPRAGELYFDGAASLSRVRSWPTVVQVVDADGRVATTAYLLPSDPMPVYKAVPLPKQASVRKPAPLPLIAGAVGAGVASAVLFGVGASTAGSLDDAHPDWDNTDLEGGQARANGLLVASGATGLLAVGATVLAVTVRW